MKLIALLHLIACYGFNFGTIFLCRCTCDIASVVCCNGSKNGEWLKANEMSNGSTLATFDQVSAKQMKAAAGLHNRIVANRGCSGFVLHGGQLLLSKHSARRWDSPSLLHCRPEEKIAKQLI